MTKQQIIREASLNTVRHKQLDFRRVFNLDIIADFKGGDITSDSGGLLVKEVDIRYRITEAALSVLSDSRQPGKVDHRLLDLLRQRIYQIVLGYEDQNDADDLRRDPSLKTMVGRRPQSDPDLGSQPTLCQTLSLQTA